MKPDLLREATTALSESGHDQGGGKFTRERIVATLHENQRQGRARRALLLPLAAIFLGSTAFAAVNGSLSRVVRSALDAVGFPVEAPVAVDGPPSPPPARRRGAAPDRSPAKEPDATGFSEPTPEQASRQLAEPTATSANAAHERAATPPAPPQVVADGLALYRRGHDAQFKEANPARALQAYDAYLKEQPEGRFAVDARYNRALCLVRLGRHAEARTALRPFANGDFGDYRKHDAERLLEALNR